MTQSDDETTGLLSRKNANGYSSNRSSPCSPRSHPEGMNVRSPSRQFSVAEIKHAITLSWDDIDVFVKKEGRGLNCCKDTAQHEPPKQILSKVSGVVNPGTLLAVMGASGAGKTTLMNVLTHRNLNSFDVTSSVKVNGCSIGSDITTVSAYVQQEDLLIGTLKVKEHLWFQAMLKMDRHVTKSDRRKRVEEVMNQLSLQKCADTIIGTPGKTKGISGGEKKRLAFASEVLTDPALMFCDEPTSGLDSYMAQSVVQNLKDLAANGKTILCTIHQPSSEVYAMFDKVLILAEGSVGFMGSAENALQFFDGIGFTCPANYNPADFFIQTLAIVPGQEMERKARVQSVCAAFEKSPEFDDIATQLGELGPSGSLDPDSPEVNFFQERKRYHANWIRQFMMLLWRAWVANSREPMVTKIRIIQTIVVAVLFGIIYLHPKGTYDQKDIMNINSALFLLQMQMSMGNIFPVVQIFPLEYPVFRKEHHDHMYRVDTYFLAKMLAEVPIFIFTPVLFTSITYWMMGFYHDLEVFLFTVVVMVIIANVATSFGYLISTATNSLTVALSVTPVILMPFALFGGFFVNSESVPVYFIWLKYISWFNYANEIMVVQQWEHVTNISCPMPAGNATDIHCYKNGNAVIDSFNFEKDRVFQDYMVLIGLLVGFRTLAFILLLIKSRRSKS